MQQLVPFLKSERSSKTADKTMTDLRIFNVCISLLARACDSYIPGTLSAG